MVKIEPFQVEQWMDAYETTAGVLNIAETCASSLSIADLAGLAVPTGVDGTTSVSAADPLSALATTRLTYGAIQGSSTLRKHVAELFDEGKDANVPPLPADSVVVTQGAIAANHLAFYTLLGPGDHAICVYPTYQQLYGVPQSLGAEVSLWKLKLEKGYVPDTAELENLVRPNTKMIIVNNPNNPMGVPIPRAVLEAIVRFARARDIIILSDEVYLPLTHGGMLAPDPDESNYAAALTLDEASEPRVPPPPPPSILTLGYDKVIATGSMSKAFALAGLRLGWVASRDRALVDAILAARDYTTISVSQLDDGIARYALSDSVRDSLLRRNNDLARRNIRHLNRFVGKWESKGRVRVAWVPPTAGTTAFVQFSTVARGDDSSAAATPVDDKQFCLDVLHATQVLMVPGSLCFGHGKDFKGYVRIGYVSETAVLVEALSKLDRYLENNLA
ncbi:hypothetical protein HMPREF1624_03097 [Sporothrix schenckii ATCC 58251]|uniref:Aminotransferase class I/classII large domain-containing protein n=2 Tax=Sporothrix schenckii TaxID=29908 RepID=U7PVQ4_SPOS1|nr:hypothetical protein HMPREF1624_03097 [Sporothrix schenckii ATCC 58251]